MERIGEAPGKPFSNARKEKDYKIRMKRWFDRTNAAADAGVDKRIVDLMVIVSDGGDCPICGLSFKWIDNDLPFGKGHYFEPACRCYPTCRRCKYNLVIEYIAGMPRNRCPNCDYDYKTGRPVGMSDKAWGAALKYNRRKGRRS